MKTTIEMKPYRRQTWLKPDLLHRAPHCAKPPRPQHSRRLDMRQTHAEMQHSRRCRMASGQWEVKRLWLAYLKSP